MVEIKLWLGSFSFWIPDSFFYHTPFKFPIMIEVRGVFRELERKIVTVDE